MFQCIVNVHPSMTSRETRHKKLQVPFDFLEYIYCSLFLSYNNNFIIAKSHFDFVAIYSAQAEGRGPSLKMQFVFFFSFFRSTSGHTVAD